MLRSIILNDAQVNLQKIMCVDNLMILLSRASGFK